MFSTVDTEDNIIQVESPSSTPSSPTKHAQSSSENSEGSKQQNNKESVTMLIKEMVFCVALALTTYGALHNTPSKVAKHPRAIKFFDSDSIVTDWHKGQLSNAHATINNVDVSFVMYYAPWDAESQFVRSEFEEAASVMSDRVHFSAINCWNPGSECRLQHAKIPSWPILIAYSSTSRGVLYKGPRDAHSMVKFLELIIKPLERISTVGDFVDLLSVCDAIAVGYTPVADNSRNYNIWYQVALKVREFDVISEICFGVVTSEDLAVYLGVNNAPSAKLLLWNDTKEYVVGESDEQTWNETSLMHWVLENFQQPVARIIPMWKKAFSFEKYVDGSPLLMLLTPLNPLYEQLPNYSMLREVAMEYYNCNNQNDSIQWTSELIRLQQVQRLKYQKKDFVKYCADYKFKQSVRKTDHYLKKGIISQNNKYPWNNKTQKLKKNGAFNSLFKSGFDHLTISRSAGDDTVLTPLGLIDECSTKIVTDEDCLGGKYEQCQSFEGKILEKGSDMGDEHISTTMLPFEDDPLSPENLIQDNVQHFCKLMKFARMWGPPISPSPSTSANSTNIQGLACVQNFSLNMIAVDSIRNHHFAESLGINLNKMKDKTAVVILDSKHESQYLMSGEYSIETVREFIYNFTNKNLKRQLRTLVDDAAKTHYFGSDGQQDQMGIDNNTVHILDLTTRTFRRVVKDPGKVTLVAVCGGGCGAATSRALAAAVRLLRTCGAEARAARLDAHRHDMPWPYTVHTYPTVFVFSTRRGEVESRKYPVGARVSRGGLVALALRSLGAPTHLRVALALCAASQVFKERKTCLSDLKQHTTTVIGRNLKYWRRSENKELKDALFNRLLHLHRVSVELSLLHVSDLSDINLKKVRLLHTLNDLSTNWDIHVSILRKSMSATTS